MSSVPELAIGCPRVKLLCVVRWRKRAAWDEIPFVWVFISNSACSVDQLGPAGDQSFIARKRLMSTLLFTLFGLKSGLVSGYLY